VTPSLPQSTAVTRQYERPLRLTTGLILFSYVVCHFINHAFGVASVEAMQAASAFLLAPWQTSVGLVTLYGSFFIHAGLGMYALYRRRHLRMPASEAWQLALGLAIPLLLIPHAGVIRLGEAVYGMEFDYRRVLYQFFVGSPDVALPRQLVLLMVVWLHGCIGLRSWLRTKPWYPPASPALASLATLVPALAVFGAVAAGLDLRGAVQSDPRLAALIIGDQAPTLLNRMITGLLTAYAGVVVAVLTMRAMRDWHARRFGSIRVTYLGQRTVSVPVGFTILEASRFNRIPHASVCGGRGRCSTCRVLVVNGAHALAEPSPVERLTLERIGTPPGVRLACQVRPAADITVDPLVRDQAPSPAASRFEAALEGGREIEIAAMFVDLRESTRMATGRLPYDALFLFDRYIQVLTGAIRTKHGHITSIAGDGVMSVFGSTTDAQSAARDAFRAALEVWRGLEGLNAEFAEEIGMTFRVGIGLHVGVAVMGSISSASQSLQFLGDTGNIAAKLEAQTKRLDCTLVTSVDALALACRQNGNTDTALVMIDGKEKAVEVAIFKDRGKLEQVIERFDNGAGGEPNRGNDSKL
jgi:adenylate cyclase